MPLSLRSKSFRKEDKLDLKSKKKSLYQPTVHESRDEGSFLDNDAMDRPPLVRKTSISCVDVSDPRGMIFDLTKNPLFLQQQIKSQSFDCVQGGSSQNSSSCESLLSSEPVASSYKSELLKTLKQPLSENNNNNHQYSQRFPICNSEEADKTKNISQIPYSSAESLDNLDDDKKTYEPYQAQQKHKKNSNEKLNKLKNFFRVRPTKDDLLKKGILKDKSYFGNTIENIYRLSENAIPEFLVKCFNLIETPENIKAMGIYRTSGNLATIQKIRLEIDNLNFNIANLDQYEKDIDVLTGLVKLFFRELNEPLIEPFLKNELNLCAENNKTIDHLIHRMHIPNRTFLMYLLDHLLKIESHKSDNKMDVYNLAICWGPTIMFLEGGSIDLVSESASIVKVLEYLLNYFKRNPDNIRQYLPKENVVQKSNSTLSVFTSNNCKTIDRLIQLIEQSTSDLYNEKQMDFSIKEKIFKKIKKDKLSELSKYKTNTNELCSVLKDLVIQNSICDKIHANDSVRLILDENSDDEKIIIIIKILQHLYRILDSNFSSRNIILNSWGDVLLKNFPSRERLPILEQLLETAGKPEVRRLTPKHGGHARPTSRYDNIP